MADFSGMDVSGILNTTAADSTLAKKVASSKDKLELDMTDFITLMVTELTNQGIDNSMDTSDMLNQMVQMQMVQSMVNMTDASIMSYSSSLVGKEVTVVDGYDSNGKPIELVGKVMGTGQYRLFSWTTTSIISSAKSWPWAACLRTLRPATRMTR